MGNVISQSPRRELQSSKKAKPFLWQREGRGLEPALPARPNAWKTCCHQYRRLKAFWTHSPLSPFLSAFVFEFAPKCSQVRARRKFAEAAVVLQRPLWGGTWGGTVVLSSPGPRVPCPGPHAPPAAPRVAARPSSHTLSIRRVYFFPDSRHIWSTYSGSSSATRHIPQDHFSGCYGEVPPSSDFQVAWQK